VSDLPCYSFDEGLDAPSIKGKKEGEKELIGREKKNSPNQKRISSEFLSSPETKMGTHGRIL
jgi:hypothetical protein